MGLGDEPTVTTSEATNLPVAAFISDLLDDAPFELWHRRFASLKLIEDAWPFLVGDSLVYAEKRGKEFEDRAVQAAADLGYKPHSLLNMKAVCSRIPPARRNKNVSYSHHAAVAYLKDIETMVLLLNDAETDDWDVKRMREEVQQITGRPAREPKDKTDWRDASLGEIAGIVDSILEDGEIGAKAFDALNVWINDYRASREAK